MEQPLLRKAKIASTKLGLTDFEKWLELELNGYMEMSVSELPAYHVLYGVPQAYSPYQGWKPIIFSGDLNSELKKLYQRPLLVWQLLQLKNLCVMQNQEWRQQYCRGELDGSSGQAIDGWGDRA